MSTAPALNERLYCAGGAADSRISLAARVALKDQQKMAPVYLARWESTCANSGRVTLPRPLSLSDFGIYFGEGAPHGLQSLSRRVGWISAEGC